MAYEPVMQISGVVLNDPELRYTQQGVPVANFRVSLNDARPESNNGKTNVPPLTIELSAWREMAENVANTLHKGTRVFGSARLTENGAYMNREQKPVGKMQGDVVDIGPSLRWASAVVTKNQGGGNRQGNGQPPQQNRSNGPAPSSEEPWATPGSGGHDAWTAGAPGQANQGNDGGWGNGGGWGDDSPF